MTFNDLIVQKSWKQSGTRLTNVDIQQTEIHVFTHKGGGGGHLATSLLTAGVLFELTTRTLISQ